jgi:hypothetical protein
MPPLGLSSAAIGPSQLLFLALSRDIPVAIYLASAIIAGGWEIHEWIAYLYGHTFSLHLRGSNYVRSPPRARQVIHQLVRYGTMRAVCVRPHEESEILHHGHDDDPSPEEEMAQGLVVFTVSMLRQYPFNLRIQSQGLSPAEHGELLQLLAEELEQRFAASGDNLRAFAFADDIIFA